MPSDNFSRPMGGRKKVRRKRPPTTAPVSDVRSSGKDYGKPKAKAYKKTPEYKKALKVAAKARPVKGTTLGPAVVLKKTSSADELGNAILRFYQGSGSGSKGRGGLAATTMSPGSTTASRLVIGTGKATVENPGKTIKSGAQAVIGTVGAIGDIILPVADTLTNPGRAPQNLEKSGKAVVRLGKGAVEDYKRRYGDLVSGDPERIKRWEDRLEKEGAGPELLDLGGVALAGGKVVGPGVRAAVRGTEKGREFMDAPRPKLRKSGGKADDQTLGTSLTRIAAQRATDKVRQYAVERPGSVVGRRNRPDDEGRVPALQPRKSAVTKSVERHNRKVAKTGGKPAPLPKRPDEVVRVRRRAQEKDQRIAASRASARSYISNKHEQGRELAAGAEKALAGLGGKERRAVFHVIQGLVPLHKGKAAIVRDLQAHKAALGKAPRGVPVLRAKTELAAIDYLIKHADEVFSPEGLARLRDYHAGEVARGRRVVEGDPSVRPATAEARARRAQGERLGIEYDPPRDAPQVEIDAYNTAYAARVKEAADAKGWPEPAYFKHEKHPLVRRSARTAGNVGRAGVDPKRTDMVLFREGRAMTGPESYHQGLAETIKRKHQHQEVANVVEDNAYDWSRGPDGKGLTPDQLFTEMDKRGLRYEDVGLIAPRKIRKAADDANVHDALANAARTGAEIRALPKDDPLRSTPGHFAYPKAVYEELMASTRPSGKGERLFGKAQGLQSAAILGLNPSWLQMQILANALQSGVGMRGNLIDWVRQETWYRNLTPEAKRIVDEAVGIAVYEGSTNAAHLGYHQGPVSKVFERIGQIPLVRTKKGTVRISDANPTTLMFRADRAHTMRFRRAVLFNELKRQQFRDLQRKVGRAQAATKQVSAMLKGDATKQLDNVLRDPAKVEAAARYVDDVLGDYLRYTAKERKFFKPYFMFYGFMRYAIKTLFYTLPVKHPLAGAIALKLGQLHQEEVYRIFGSRDVPVWALSRSYEYDDDGKLKLDERGRPMYRDLGRINPLTGPIIDVVTEGPRSLGGLVSPLFGAAADLIAGRDIQTHVPLRLNGSTAEAGNPSVGDIAQVGANRLITSTFPGRLLMGSEAQSDDSLPFLREPIEYKTDEARARDLQRQADAPPLSQQLFPAFVPRVDNTRDFLNRHDLGTAGEIKSKIAAIRKRKEALREAGLDRRNGDYPTDEWVALSAAEKVLDAVHDVYIRKPASKQRVRPLKPRPLTPEQEAANRFEERMERLTNAEQDALDRVNRRMERLEAMGGS